MIKVKNYKCPNCGKVFQGIKVWGNHMEKEHPGEIPEGWTPARYFYYLQTGKKAGKCVMCKRETEWNESTFKYNRFCNDPKCKERYRDQFKNRMIGKYGKVTLLNEPDQQRKMIMQKKNSGYYDFPDGKVGYSSSYEFDFLKMCDTFLHMSAQDIMQPSPHTYYYDYVNPEDPENEGKKFYIPDYFIPSLNLEIEIKQNTSTHPKILKIDKVKEREKDAVMSTVAGINYIKISDKTYDEFFALITKLRTEINETPIKSNGDSALESTNNAEPQQNNEFGDLYMMSPEQLVTWICANIHFDKNYGGIKEPREVVRTKMGDTQDVSYLINRILSVSLIEGPLYKIAINLKHWLAVEYNPITKDYNTETCYTFNTYEMNGKICMIRTNWGTYNGIQEFDSYGAIKAFLIRSHNKGLLGNGTYPELFINELQDAAPGINANQLIGMSVEAKTPSMESFSSLSIRRRGYAFLTEYISIEITADNKKLYQPIENEPFFDDCKGEMFITKTNELISFYSIQKNFKSKTYWLTSLWVQPAYEGKGLGTQMLDRILKNIPELHVLVPRNRDDLMAFFTHYGFTNDGTNGDGYFMSYANNNGNILKQTN